MTRNVALGAMVAAGAAWGAVFVAPSLAPLAPALLLAMGRFVAFGAVSLPRLRAVLRADVPWGRVSAHAVTGSVLYYALVAVSVRLAGPTVAVATIGLVPVVMALVSARGRGPSGVAALAPALLLVGVGQVLVHAGPGTVWTPGLLVGTLLAAAALVSWSWYGLDSHRLLHDRPDSRRCWREPRGWWRACWRCRWPSSSSPPAACRPSRCGRCSSCCSWVSCPPGWPSGSGTARPVTSRRCW